jgi:hypothetical protein
MMLLLLLKVARKQKTTRSKDGNALDVLRFAGWWMAVGSKIMFSVGLVRA